MAKFKTIADINADRREQGVTCEPIADADPWGEQPEPPTPFDEYQEEDELCHEHSQGNEHLAWLYATPLSHLDTQPPTEASKPTEVAANGKIRRNGAVAAVIGALMTGAGSLHLGQGNTANGEARQVQTLSRRAFVPLASNAYLDPVVSKLYREDIANIGVITVAQAQSKDAPLERALWDGEQAIFSRGTEHGGLSAASVLAQTIGSSFSHPFSETVKRNPIWTATTVKSASEILRR